MSSDSLNICLFAKQIVGWQQVAINIHIVKQITSLHGYVSMLVLKFAHQRFVSRLSSEELNTLIIITGSMRAVQRRYTVTRGSDFDVFCRQMQ